MAKKIIDSDSPLLGNCLADQTVALVLYCDRFGNHRNASLAHEKSGATKSELSLHKRLLKSKELQAVEAKQREARDLVAEEGLPSQLGDGVHLIPLARVNVVTDKLKAIIDALPPLVEAFIDALPALKAKAKEDLKEHFREADYLAPDAIREKIKIRYRFIQIGVMPPQLSAIASPELLAEVKAELHASNLATAADARQQLRQELLELVDRIAERLDGVNEKGKQKTFTHTMLADVHQWLSTFPARDVTQDARLQAIAKDLTTLLVGVDDKALRKDPGVRQDVAVGAAALVKRLKTAVSAKASSRALVLEVA